MASDTVQEIKEKLDIVEVLRQYIALQPAGKNLKALCPFHKEKTPSFMVSPERQSWHCFGCSLGGDIFSFVQRYENVEFFDALKMLAEKAGVTIKRSGSPDQKRFDLLYEIMAEAKEAFKKALFKSERAQKYLSGRFLTKDALDVFELGFAPNTPDALLRYLIKKGYKIDDIERAGLVVKNERGRYTDRFRGRIMFPIMNHFGKVIAFTGRAFDEEEKSGVAKYVNSPDTPLFNKSKVLFAYDKAKSYIREKRSVVLVEGQMDAIMLWQSGIKNVVASSGTALSEDHLKTLSRVAETIIIAFDNDEAGRAAAERAIDLAAKQDLVVKVLLYEGVKNVKDPADIAQKDPNLLKKLIDEAPPAMMYFFEKYPVEGQEDLTVFKRNIRLLLSKIKSMQSAVERDRWLNILSQKSGIAQHSLLEEMSNVKTGFTSAVSFNKQPLQVERFSRKERIAAQLIHCVMLKNNLLDKLGEYEEYLPKPYQDALHTNFKVMDFRLPAFLDFSVVNESNAEEYFFSLVRQLKIEFLKEKRQELRRKHKEAVAKGDEGAADAILKQIDDISKKLHNL